jgi:23S rRNA U2552 (ribose-2'-O)-methylase RlmE/FtsJ
MDGLTITDLIWDSSYFTLDLIHNNEIKMNFEENEISDKIPRPSRALVDITEYKKILDTKEKIKNCNNWDKLSRLTNPYDKIYNIAKNKNNKDYYKFFEILKYTGIKFSQESSSLHIGTLNSVKALTYFSPKIDWNVLYSKKTSIQNSRSQNDLSKILENEFENIKDNKGYSRITDIEEKNFYNDLKKFSTSEKIDVIIADYVNENNYDETNQEQYLFYILFCEVYKALSVQKENGYFLIKIFDNVTRPTCQLIYYLARFYETVTIIKPRTSRYTDSEKFVMCKKFKSISEIELRNIELFINGWKPELFTRLLGIKIPEEIENQFLNYNKNLIENQYNYIQKTLSCNHNDPELPEKQMEAFQNKLAIIFCNNFNIQVNLSESINSSCRHDKKRKIKIGKLKSISLCEKCFTLFIYKKNEDDKLINM